jgi:radical SAM superfamily enzyme YgiQ (UPF0313 family)
MEALAQKTKSLGYKLEQVQDFTPTPMTIATETYYTGYDIISLNPKQGKNKAKKIYSAKTKQDKLKQNSAFFWWKNNNHRKN